MNWVELRSKPLSYHVKKLKLGYQFLENDRGKAIALSPGQRKLVGGANRLANLPRYLRRWLQGKQAVAASKTHARMTNGYVVMPALEGYQEIVDLCEAQMVIYHEYLQEGRAALKRRGIKPSLYEREIAKTADDPLKHVPCHYDAAVLARMIDFALQPHLIATAAEHLGVLPVLAGLRILYSPNEEGPLDRAQLFHLDPEGARQAKGFMAVRPVGPENSPFTFVPADISTAMLKSGDPIYTSKRVPDKYIHRMAPNSTWIAHMGQPGDALFVDTSRCFHFGSRPNKKPRLLFYFSYLDPFSSFHPIVAKGGDGAAQWRSYTGKPSPYTDEILSRRL